MKDRCFNPMVGIAFLVSVSVAADINSVSVSSSVPVDRSLPPEPNTVFMSFLAEVKAADWDKALMYCSADVQAKAAEYDSVARFFNAVVPINQVISPAKYDHFGGLSYRNNIPVRYTCEVKLKDPAYRYPLRWNLSVLKEDLHWVVDFPVKPLDIWLKHEILKSKLANRELEIDYEKNRAGFEVSLIPLSDEFIIGQPMLFRLEMKNISSETLCYTQTSYLVNDPMLITAFGGERVPFYEGDCQTGGAKEFAEPNDVIVLTEKYDVRSGYHIVKPGRYSFQFKNSSTPSSNIVEMNVQPGPLSPLEECVERIRTVLPPRWGLTRRIPSTYEFYRGQSGEEILIQLTGKRAPKTSTTEKSIGISIAIFPDPSTDSQMLEHASKYDFWGNSPLGTICVRAGNAEELWPDYREQLIKALQIEI